MMQTPTIDKFLGKNEVTSWTVDDLTRSFRKIESKIQRIEVSMAKKDSRAWGQSKDIELKLLREINATLSVIAEGLNTRSIHP